MGRSGRVAPWACALAIVGLGGEAFAGDTTGDGSTSASDSGSTSDTDSGSEADTNGDEFCGDDCSGAGEVTIVSPSDGDTVAPTFTVTLEATDDCYCDTCGCFPEAAESIGLALDGANVGSCAESPCMIEVAATPGEHTLRASAQWFFTEAEMTITIHVEGDDATDTGSATGGDDAATQATAEDTTPDEGGSESNDSTAGAGNDDAAGCGCRAEPTGSGAFALALPLALLGAFARPRRLRC